MLLYINDRVLLSGQRLKVLLVAPEMGAVAPQPGVPPPDLRVGLTLLSQDGQPVDLPWQRPYAANEFAHLRVPFSYAEISTDKLAPGAYVVRATNGPGTVVQMRLMVLDSKQYAAIASMTGQEQLSTDGTRLATTSDVVQAWFRSWEEFYSYLGTVIPSHVIATAAPSVGGPTSAPRFAPSAAVIGELRSETFRWVNFHFDRFVFDQLFYGGTVALQQFAADGPLGVRLVLQHRVKPQEPVPNKEYLDLLGRMLKDSRFSILLAYNATNPAPGFAYQANLDVTWRFASSVA